MAGRVPGHILLDPAGYGYTINPMHCPGADDHRREATTFDSGLAPVCRIFNDMVGMRSCPYLIALADQSLATRRVDGSTLYAAAVELGKSQLRLTILCLCQRRNVPPGV